MAGISTHVLDTVTGRPGAGMKIDFYKYEGNVRKLVKSIASNKDGRTDQPVLAADAAQVGQYELVFHVDQYFASQGVKLPDPAFLEEVVVRFSIFDVKQHYHVPMLCSPWSCTTYRGS